MSEPTDDMTTAYMAGFHKRDDEVAALKRTNAELLTILKRVRVTKAIKNYSLVKAIEAAIRKAGD